MAFVSWVCVLPKSLTCSIAPVADTRELDENTILDVDANGNICAITVEHASERTDIPKFSYEQVAA